ncbi:MAG: CHRD domain-containing protein [Myxococcales bacterium]|nr:CHRD domain-containing protein [Myxococcales bacterium]
MNKHVVVMVFVAVSGCGGTMMADGGMSVGGGAAGGGAAGGAVAGGSAGGVAGGSAGGAVAGGSAGGAVAGGSAGGAVAGGSAGGAIAGGAAGGSGGGSAGGAVAGGSAGGGTGGGTLTLPDGGLGTTFVAMLKGASEVPPNTSTATGFATVVVDPSNTLIAYRVTHTLAAPVSAQLSLGIATVNGSTVVPFSPATSPITGTASLTVPQANALRDGRMYVNVQTSAFANGELRGQLLRPREQLLTAVLSGAEVVPPVTTIASGGLQYMLDADAGFLRCAGFYEGMVATNSTLLRGDGGVNGTALAPIDRTTFGIADGGLLFCGDNLIQPALVDLLVNGQTYGLVRSAAFPAGELRGQLQLAP